MRPLRLATAATVLCLVLGLGAGAPAFAQPAATTAAALAQTPEQASRLLGLDQSDAVLGFQSRTVKPDRVEFSQVTLPDLFSADTMTVTVPGSTRTPVVTFDKVRLAGADGAVTAERLILTGIAPRLLSPAIINNLVRGRGAEVIKGSLRLEGIRFGAPQGSPMQVASLEVTDLELSAKRAAFGTLEMNGLAGPIGDGGQVALARLRLAGISDGAFGQLANLLRQDPQSRTPLDLGALQIAEARMVGLAVRPPRGPAGGGATGTAGTDAAPANPTPATEVSIGEIAITDVGMSATGDILVRDVRLSAPSTPSADAAAPEASTLTLGRFSVSDINVPYLAASVLGALNQPVPPDWANRTLAQVTPGGALALAASGMTFSGFRFAAPGLRAEIDQLDVVPVRDAAGVVTGQSFTPGRFTLSANGATSGQVVDLLRQLGRETLSLSWTGSTVWSPQTDVSDTRGVTLDAPGFGSLSAQMAVGEVQRWMRETTLGEIAAYTRRSLEAQATIAAQSAGAAGEDGVANDAATADASAKPRPRNPDARETSQTMRELLAPEADLFAAMTLVSMNMTVTDGGMLDFMARREAPGQRSGTTPAQVREQWAQPLAEIIARKSEPGWVRLAAAAARRFLLAGGSVSVSLAPPQPVGLGRLIAPDLTPETLGLETSYRPPAPARP